MPTLRVRAALSNVTLMRDSITSRLTTSFWKLIPTRWAVTFPAVHTRSTNVMDRTLNRHHSCKSAATSEIGMSGLSYHSRLKALNLESLELRRLRADLLLAYKILFGLLRVNSDICFTPRNQSQLRGHAYMLHKQRCFSSNRRNFFQHSNC